MRDLLAALSELRERLKEIPQADERRLQDLKTEVLGRKAGALAELPPGPPRPGRPGLLLPGRGPAAANPHLARTDSHARALPAAHPGGDPGTGVPARPVRRLALAGFRAARGPRGGRGNHLRGLQ